MSLASDQRDPQQPCQLCFGPRSVETGGRTIACPECGSLVPDFSTILRRLTVPRELFESFPVECIRERHCIPIAYDNERNVFTVAIDFSDPEAAEFFRFVANREVETVFADRAAIFDALERSLAP